MSNSNALQIVQQYYQYFNDKNWKGMLSLVDEQIRHEPNQGNPRIGIQKFEEFLQMMDTAYEETLSEMVFFSANETRIAVEFVVNGKYLKADEGFPEAHGQSYVLPAAAFLEVKNNKITRVTTYYNLQKWIELVSL